MITRRRLLEGASAGAALAGMGKYAEAEDQLVRSYTVLSNNDAVFPMYRTLARHYLEDLYRKWGRPQDARRYAAANSSSAAAAQSLPVAARSPAP